MMCHIYHSKTVQIKLESKNLKDTLEGFNKVMIKLIYLSSKH